MARTAFVPLRCVRTGRFMVGRFNEQDGSWNLVDLKVVEQATGQPPAAGQLHLAGSFGVAPAYAGCPDCGNGSYIRCGSCGSLTCYLGEGGSLCMTCGTRAVPSGAISEVNPFDVG